MPDDLRDLVDVAHNLGLAVYLDVIYNHLGPDGAYVAAFAPMFTEKHHTPWGDAINLDDRYSDGVRHLFIDNALYWLREFHIDGLRLDATNALKDDSTVHFLAELAAAVEAFEPGPPRHLFAEDHRNLSALVLPQKQGGHGLDGVWVDDFHHQVRNLTAGDVESYYAAYEGTTARDIATTLEQGWFYTGQRNPVTGEPRGTDPSDVRSDQCVFCIQNHDQIGNRAQGERLSDDVAPEVFRAASALLLFAPELPLLFMGQEWAADTPFQFFTDHNEELGRLVTEGRKKEFEKFSGFGGAGRPRPPGRGHLPAQQARLGRARAAWARRGAEALPGPPPPPQRPRRRHRGGAARRRGPRPPSRRPRPPPHAGAPRRAPARRRGRRPPPHRAGRLRDGRPAPRGRRRRGPLQPGRRPPRQAARVGVGRRTRAGDGA